MNALLHITEVSVNVSPTVTNSNDLHVFSRLRQIVTWPRLTRLFYTNEIYTASKEGFKSYFISFLINNNVSLKSLRSCVNRVTLHYQLRRILNLFL